MRRVIVIVIMVSVLLAGVGVPAVARRGGSGRTEPFWSPDGRWLLVVSHLVDADGLWIFDATDWDAPPRLLVSFAPVATQPNPTARLVYDVAFSPDGDRMATAEASDGVRLWDTATFEPVSVFDVSGSAVAFSADGALLAADHRDRAVRVFDVGSGELVREVINRHVWAIEFGTGGLMGTAGCLSMDGGCEQGAAWVWDVDSGRLRDIVYGSAGWMTDVAFHPAGDELAVSGALDWVGTWHLPTSVLTELHAAPAGADPLLTMADAVAYSPDGALLAYGLSDGTIVIWDRAAETEHLTLHQLDWVAGIAFSPDGALVATGGIGSGVHIWDTATGDLRATLLGTE